MRYRIHASAGVLAVVAMLFAGQRPGLANILDAAPDRPLSSGPSAPIVRVAQISGDPAKPRRHFRLRNAARVKPDEAREIYRRIGEEMAAGYRGSGHPVAAAYRGWRKYNLAPYRSAAHGNRYINNYANGRARAYGKYEDAGTFPVGSIIAKDSFSVTEDGEILSAPLFIMEKMPANFSYVSGDWRYTMIMPDGSVFGVTKGENSDRVDFCIGCHLAVEGNDHLYFVPKSIRAVPAAAE